MHDGVDLVAVFLVGQQGVKGGEDPYSSRPLALNGSALQYAERALVRDAAG